MAINRPARWSSHEFFNFFDIKPEDWSEGTISLHVYNNDVWGWLKISAVKNYENGCTEPEGKVDATCDNPGLGQGEPYGNLHFLVWMDDGDNVYETGGKILHEGGTLPICQVWQLDGDACCTIDPTYGSHGSTIIMLESSGVLALLMPAIIARGQRLAMKLRPIV